jgi:formiminotetrahydrofolate cyclodeaminase
MSSTIATTTDCAPVPLDRHEPLAAGAAAAVSGAMAAWLLAEACQAGMGRSHSPRAADELRSMRDRALSIRRDLIALVEQSRGAREALLSTSAEPPASPDPLLHARLFAAEVPLRTAGSCHLLLDFALRALSRAGVRSIEEIGTAAALAHAGVMGGVLAARAALAPVADESLAGVALARKRAEQMLRDAEALRTQITDRVRRHIP